MNEKIKIFQKIFLQLLKKYYFFKNIFSVSEKILYFKNYFLVYRKNIFQKIVYPQLTKKYFSKKYIFSKSIFSSTESILFFQKYFLTNRENISPKKYYFAHPWCWALGSTASLYHASTICWKMVVDNSSMAKSNTSSTCRRCTWLRMDYRMWFKLQWVHRIVFKIYKSWTHWLKLIVSDDFVCFQ